jgi:molybdopterin converting factor subunit 1
MNVLFFAQSRRLTGCDSHLLRVDQPLTASEFWTLLGKEFPSLVPLQKTARLARNETYLQEWEQLQPYDEIAVIPPVSGG